MTDKSNVKVRMSDLFVGRVLHEDDDFVTLEVAKDENRPLRIEDGDKFLTLLFIKSGNGKPHVWNPWEEE